MNIVYVERLILFLPCNLYKTKPKHIKKEFYANGKLLISGEYAVLDGAKAIVLPTQCGQRMTVKNSRGSDLVWIAYDHEGNQWFKSNISLYDFSAINTTDEAVSKKIQKILKNAVRQNSEFLSKWNGFKVETYLDFPRSWGLGSSATVYKLVSDWSDINPLLLYFKIESGSGADVACAVAGTSITYVSNEEEINYTTVEFDPSFKDQLYFVHLNQKQDSSLGIMEYLKVVKQKKEFVSGVTQISEELIAAKDISTFSDLIDRHEDLVHHHTGFKKVKDERFSEYHGSIKSLGAWGGDFVMVTSDKSPEETLAYFNDKGYHTVLPYQEMILKS